MTRMNIQVLKAADFSKQERGCTKSVTVQKICRIAKEENEVCEILDDVWRNRSEEILAKARACDTVLFFLVSKNDERYPLYRSGI